MAGEKPVMLASMEQNIGWHENDIFELLPILVLKSDLTKWENVYAVLMMYKKLYIPFTPWLVKFKRPKICHFYLTMAFSWSIALFEHPNPQWKKT